MQCKEATANAIKSSSQDAQEDCRVKWEGSQCLKGE